MKHIKLPVQIDSNGVGTFCDVGSGNIKFEAVIIVDQDEQICLVPTDLKSGPEKIAAEIVQACNCFDDLLATCEAQHKLIQQILDAYEMCAINFDWWDFDVAEWQKAYDQGQVAKGKGDQCSA